MGQPLPTPIPLTPAASPNDFLGIPAYIWILVAAVIIVQSIAFVCRRRRRAMGRKAGLR